MLFQENIHNGWLERMNSQWLTMYKNNSRNSSKYEHCSPHKI